eukprot:gnl/Hemi2/28597_TR9478_c0_g2_i1.p2 gnl/Hemi2/28597_TR9478_c0_g2~~gnl/Hemi2/28597_TR9478_c0_g2_i1.p2  ORF type:complete len:190 (+),score=24.88 gnl/Hemi2/28597_TR9478_c0_g2_i1:377-946(+)
MQQLAVTGPTRTACVRMVDEMFAAVGAARALTMDQFVHLCNLDVFRQRLLWWLPLLTPPAAQTFTHAQPLMPGIPASLQSFNQSLQTLTTQAAQAQRAATLAQQQQLPTEAVHPLIECDGCGMTPIRGVRYSCRDCAAPGYDLCATCYASRPYEPSKFPALNHNATHVFVVKDPPPQNAAAHPNQCPMQ